MGFMNPGQESISDFSLYRGDPIPLMPYRLFLVHTRGRVTLSLGVPWRRLLLCSAIRVFPASDIALIVGEILWLTNRQQKMGAQQP